MTTIIFYKGIMGCDTLETRFGNFMADRNLDLDGPTFSLARKIYIINDHQLAMSGEVRSIKKFIRWYKNQDQEFKPDGKFSVIDWDGENLMSWWTEETSMIRMFLNLITFSSYRVIRMKYEDLKYDEEEECVYTIGSGEKFVSTAFFKLAFLFYRLEEKILDHLTKEEVIKYLIMVASKHDRFTNDKVYIENFTSVSPQNASLLKE